jgi:tetratricopeptide (TPR) repeat protein
MNTEYRISNNEIKRRLLSAQVAIIALCAVLAAQADEIYTKNKKANRLYKQEKYEEALKLYDDALLESPGNKKLSMNKGSAHYNLGDYDNAQQSYETALSQEDKRALADLHYNLGNTFFRQGEQLQAGGNQQAMEKYKAAYESYIKSLDLRPKDGDAKHNLQLAYRRIKQLEQQQQKQNKQEQKKGDKQDNKDQQKQDQQNKQDKQDKKDEKQQQDRQKEQKDKQKQDKQQQQERKEKKEKQQPKPQPQKQESDMEKKEAQRLLQQYADDADALNKPRKKMRIGIAGKPEKDW